MSFHVPNRWRIRKGRFGTEDAIGNMGAFFVPTPGRSVSLRCVAHDGLARDDDDEPDLLGWEHVSVFLLHRYPTWAEMTSVKNVFWDAEDVVMQLHPARSQWVNCHPHCLHLWRPLQAAIPLPPMQLVGPQAKDNA